MGYESVNSLLNLKTVSIVVTTYIIRMAISGFLKLIMKISKKLCGKTPRKVRFCYKFVSDGLYFGAFIGLTLESYLEFLISSYLTLTNPLKKTSGDIISLSLASILAFLAIIFVPIASIWMIF
jgi:hypothetical protein